MTSLNTIPAFTLAQTSLSLHEVLLRLHQRGGLLPLLREAGAEELILQQAHALGLTVTAEELQQAANAFRSQQGLASAELTHAWLARQQLSVQDFESALERDLLIEKLKDHLTRDRIPGYFAAHQADYTHARLRQIVVAREDLARELLTQVQEEGRDFAALARQHSLHPSRAEGGQLGEVLPKQLPAAVAEAVFAARAGDLVGPLATPEGFYLCLVEALDPAELDADTSALIRQELFEAWLQGQLQAAPLTFPLLDVL